MASRPESGSTTTTATTTTRERRSTTPVSYTQGYYNYSYDLKGTIERASLFAQDSWRITPTFTVNVGVRAEFNQGQRSRRQDKIFDNTAVAPRLGFAWDVTKDGKTVVKGHYGRYFEKFVATEFYYAKPGAFTPLTSTATSIRAATSRISAR